MVAAEPAGGDPDSKISNEDTTGMANGFSQEFSFLPAELVFKTHEFVRAYHKIHGSGWLFVRKAHVRATHSAYLTGLERRIVIEGIIFRIALGCIFVFAVAALFLNIWLGALSAIAILTAFFLARQTKFDLVQERALIIAMEMLSIDFAGWGTLFPSARDEARKWLEDNPFGVEAKLLDTYMPAEKRSGFIDDFRPSEQSVRLAATGGRGNSEIPLWAAFRGKPNTANLLQEKAMIVVVLITRVLDDGVVLASAWMQDRKMGDREAVRAKVETAAFWLRVIDEIGFMCLNPADRDTFMDALEAGVTKELGVFGVDASEFQSLLQERYSEYSQYRKWIFDKDETARGTLFWEFAKKIAAILGIGKHAFFNLSLSSLLMKRLDRWDLPTLMKG